MKRKQPKRNLFDCDGWRAFILRGIAVDALVRAALQMHRLDRDQVPRWLVDVRRAAHAAALPHGANDVSYLAAYAKALQPLVAAAAAGRTLH